MAAIPHLLDSPAALEALSHVEVVYTDLDGTLLGVGGSLLIDGDGQPSAEAAEAIVRLNAAGLTIVPVTGRNRIQCAEIARLVEWRGFIAELGCVIVPDRGAEPSYFLGEWTEEMLEPGETPYEAIVRDGAPELLREAFPGLLEPHAPYHLNREATYLVRGFIDLAVARDILGRSDLPVDIVDNGIIHPPVTGLSPDLPEIHAYHLMAPGVSKAAAVAEDLARRGLTHEKAASIGDAPPDVEMADATALGVLVGNALHNADVAEAARARDNVFAVDGQRTTGWAQFASAWLAARA